MAGVNTAGTFRLKNGATLTVDDGGTGEATLELAAQSIAVIAEQNYASHPRTGDGPPSEEYIDATYTLELSYMQGFGTDGIFETFEALAGTEVDWVLQTAAAVSASTPSFTFTAVVPALSPLPSTEWGEFAQGDVTVPIKGVPVKAVT